MDILAVDIETMPNPEMISRLPEVEADSRLKDEAKIKADIEKKKEEQIKKMALNPLYGKIACIGYYGDKIKEVDLRDEKEMIQRLMDLWNDNLIVTWNGKAFDFEFIIKRGVILGLCPLTALERFTSRYSKYELHIDLMEKWCGFGKFAKLNEVAQVLLNGECKEEFDVEQIPELIKTPTGQELIKRYCLQDCKLTYDLAKKMGY